MNILNIDTSYIGSHTGIKDKMNKLFELANYIHRYVENPLVVINELLATLPEDSPDRASANEIVIGLGGAFTNNRARELGMELLLKHIESHFNSIKEEFDLEGGKCLNVFDTVYENKAYIDNNTATDVILERAKQYEVSEVMKDFSTNKLPSVIVPMLTEYNSGISVTEFLATLQTALEQLSDTENYGDTLDKLYRTYANKVEYIELLVKRYRDNFEAVIVQDTVKVPEFKTTSDTVDLILENKVDVVDEIHTPLEMLTTCIEKLIPVYKRIADVIDKTRDVLNVHKGVWFHSITHLARFLDIIKEYGTSKITKDEYLKEIAIYRNIVNNSINTEIAIITNVLSIINDVNIKLNTYYVINTMLDKIVLAVTIDKLSYNVNGKV